MNGLNTKKKIQQWLIEHNRSPKPASYHIHDNLTVDIEGDMVISNLSLSEIPMQFGWVKGTFRCSHNNLTSLKGSPRKVDNDFQCEYNFLETLEYSPEEIGKSFLCHDNKLKSFKGVTPHIPRNFSCENNKLVSFEFAPLSVGGLFDCRENNFRSIEDLKIVVLGSFLHDSSDGHKIPEFADKYNNYSLYLSGEELTPFLLHQKLSRDMQEKSVNNKKKKI